VDNGGNDLSDECTGACPEDLTGDGVVNGEDLGLLISLWGSCSGCPEDLNGDGAIDGADLGLFFAAWGGCS
jgi:hypothetical protein